MDQANDSKVAYHERSLYASLWTMYGFTVIIMVLRFWSRIARGSLGQDDWVMLAGWILYSVGVGLSTAVVAHGSLKHISTIAENDLIWILKVSNIIQIFGIWSQTLAKTSVGLLIPRLLATGRKFKWRLRFLYLNLVVNILAAIADSFMIFFECNPPKALWDIDLVKEGKASCPRVNVNTEVTLFQSSFGIWMDFLLAILPATMVYSLKLPLKRKLAISCLLGMGLFAGICAIVKTLQFTNGFGSADPTFNTYGLFLWAYLEIPFIIIAGSVAPAKPAMDKLLTGRGIRTGASLAVVSNSSRSSGNSRDSRLKRWKMLSSSSSSNNSGEKGIVRDTFFDRFGGGAQVMHSISAEEEGKTLSESTHSNQIQVDKSYSVEHNDNQ